MAVIGSSKGWNNLRRKSNPKNKDDKYPERTANLNALGFSTYSSYLSSHIWKFIRDRQLERFPNCRICKQRASQVHHLDYRLETLVGKGTIGVVSVCRDCHIKIEFEDGVKLDKYQSYKKAAELSGTELTSDLKNQSVSIRRSSNQELGETKIKVDSLNRMQKRRDRILQKKSWTKRQKRISTAKKASLVHSGSGQECPF